MPGMWQVSGGGSGGIANPTDVDAYDTLANRGLYGGNGTTTGFLFFTSDTGQIYRANGAGWTAITPLGTDARFSLPVTVPQGGTGLTTLTAHALIVGNGAGAFVLLALGTAGQVLTSNGAGVDPSMQNISVAALENGAIVTILARNFLK